MCRSGHLSLVAIFGVLFLGGTHAPFGIRRAPIGNCHNPDLAEQIRAYRRAA
jgi:hypothetical protein